MDKTRKGKAPVKKKIVLKAPNFRKEKMESVDNALKSKGDEHLKDLIHLPLGNSGCCC